MCSTSRKARSLNQMSSLSHGLCSIHIRNRCTKDNCICWRNWRLLAESQAFTRNVAADSQQRPFSQVSIRRILVRATELTLREGRRVLREIKIYSLYDNKIRMNRTHMLYTSRYDRPS